MVRGEKYLSPFLLCLSKKKKKTLLQEPKMQLPVLSSHGCPCCCIFTAPSQGRLEPLKLLDDIGSVCVAWLVSVEWLTFVTVIVEFPSNADSTNAINLRDTECVLWTLNNLVFCQKQEVSASTWSWCPATGSDSAGPNVKCADDVMCAWPLNLMWIRIKPNWFSATWTSWDYIKEWLLARSWWIFHDEGAGRRAGRRKQKGTRKFSVLILVHHPQVPSISWTLKVLHWWQQIQGKTFLRPFLQTLCFCCDAVSLVQSLFLATPWGRNCGTCMSRDMHISRRVQSFAIVDQKILQKVQTKSWQFFFSWFLEFASMKRKGRKGGQILFPPLPFVTLLQVLSQQPCSWRARGWWNSSQENEFLLKILVFFWTTLMFTWATTPVEEWRSERLSSQQGQTGPDLAGFRHTASCLRSVTIICVTWAHLHFLIRLCTTATWSLWRLSSLHFLSWCGNAYWMAN